MTCHGTEKLKPNGTFQHGGKTHKKFICVECQARWQWSPESGYYQIHNKPHRSVHSLRWTEAQDEEIMNQYGSRQAWADEHLPKGDE